MILKLDRDAGSAVVLAQGQLLSVELHGQFVVDEERDEVIGFKGYAYIRVGPWGGESIYVRELRGDWESCKDQFVDYVQRFEPPKFLLGGDGDYAVPVSRIDALWIDSLPSGKWGIFFSPLYGPQQQWGPSYATLEDAREALDSLLVRLGGAV